MASLKALFNSATVGDGTPEVEESKDDGAAATSPIHGDNFEAMETATGQKQPRRTAFMTGMGGGGGGDEDPMGAQQQNSNNGSIAMRSFTGRSQREYHEPVPNTMYYRNQGSINAIPLRPKLSDLLAGIKAIGQDGEDGGVEGGGRPRSQGGGRSSSDMPMLFDLAGSSRQAIALGSSSRGGGGGGEGEGGGASGEEARDQRDKLEGTSGSLSGGLGASGSNKGKGYEFGMWEGVFIRCLLNIWGVMMFLRLSWVVGEAGIGLGVVVVLLAVTLTTLTTVSLSAICTNGEIKGGGAYYMISRSLGPSFGGSIGLAFYCANSISVALYLIGFAEAVGIMQDGSYLVNRTWDQAIFALGAMAVLAGVAYVGADFEIKAQKVLLVVMTGALVSYFAGTFAAGGGDVEEDGITGLKGGTFRSNFGPDFSSGESFVTVFGVFFPAVTGIMAGANISGDLKDPQKAIPNGTFMAIALSTIVYVGMACTLGSSVQRDTLKAFEDAIVSADISAFSPLVFAGIFAATLSSALAQIIGAPRILMALARDDIFPFLKPFKKGLGSKDEPINGYLLTFAIATVAILAGDLNTVSPLITNFFLVSYALVNYACFASSISRSPGWRPSYKLYNPWVALFSAILCFAVMLMTEYITAGITIVLCGLLYKYVDWSKPDVNWGSAGEAYRYVQAVNSVCKLQTAKSHVKNYRPQYLVLVKDPRRKASMVRFLSQLNDGRGAMVVGRVIIGRFEDHVAAHRETRDDNYLVENGIQGFMDVVVAPTLLLGCEGLLQLGGMGRLRPNTVMMGYKMGWEEAPDEDVKEYVDIIRASFGTGCAVGVIRGVDDLGLLKIPPGGTLDVWWLVDDGGLTILIPHLLRQHKNWAGCKIRVHTLAKRGHLTSEQVRMSRLLRKFRINAELVMVDTAENGDFEPSAEAKAKFEATSGGSLSEKDKSLYFLRLSALLHKYSKDSSMLIVTLPVPRYSIPPRRYMAYLELLSASLPPCLLLRGNQESVITYHN